MAHAPHVLVLWYVTRKRIKQILDAARKSRILVVGDMMLDHFVWGDVTRISPEAPIPIVKFEHENFMPGGAANVAHNLSTLGISTRVYGVVGSDQHGHQLSQFFSGIPPSGFIPSVQFRRTTVKTRIIAQSQQVVRLDQEDTHDIDSTTTQQLLSAIADEAPHASAIILCDYAKGVITQQLVDGIKKLGVMICLDPKPRSLKIDGLNLITPNRKEVFEMTCVSDTTKNPDPMQDAQLLKAAEQLMLDCQPGILLVTLGAMGSLLWTHDAKRPFHVPPVKREVVDVSGAGDTTIAVFTLAMVAGATPKEAAILAAKSSGITVGKLGTSAVTAEELCS